MLIYIPKRCCIERCGYLLGCIDVVHSTCCITGLMPFSENNVRFAAVNPLPHCTFGVIGTWTSDSDLVLSRRSRVNHSCGLEHLLSLWRIGDKLFVSWNPTSNLQQPWDRTGEFVFILYDSSHFSSSVGYQCILQPPVFYTVLGGFTYR